MNNFNPLIHSFPYLLRGAGMTVLMAATAVVPATVLGVLLALLQVSGNRAMRAGVIAYLFVIRGIPLLVLLTFAYYLLPLTGIEPTSKAQFRLPSVQPVPVNGCNTPGPLPSIRNWTELPETVNPEASVSVPLTCTRSL